LFSRVADSARDSSRGDLPVALPFEREIRDFRPLKKSGGQFSEIRIRDQGAAGRDQSDSGTQKEKRAFPPLPLSFFFAPISTKSTADDSRLAFRNVSAMRRPDAAARISAEEESIAVSANVKVPRARARARRGNAKRRVTTVRALNRRASRLRRVRAAEYANARSCIIELPGRKTVVAFRDTVFLLFLHRRARVCPYVIARVVSRGSSFAVKRVSVRGFLSRTRFFFARRRNVNRIRDGRAKPSLLCPSAREEGLDLNISEFRPLFARTDGRPQLHALIIISRMNGRLESEN